MAIKGKITWVPAVIVDELEDIRRENNIYDQAEAMKQLVNYARVGRETERLIKLDWTNARKRKKIEEFFR